MPERLPHLLLILAVTSLWLGCDSASDVHGGGPEPQTTLDVVVTYPDGSPAPAYIYVDRVEDYGDRDDIPIYAADPLDGRASFTVPVDTYGVFVEALDDAPGGFEFDYWIRSRFFDQILLGEEGGAVHGYVGVTDVGMPCSGFPVYGECALLMSEEEHPDTNDSVAWAWAVRYDLDIFHIGSGLDLVRRVHTDRPLVFSDERATSARVRVIPLPEGFWDHPNPYEIPVEVLSDVEAVAVYEGVPIVDGGPSLSNDGCLPLELDAAFFFGAENGFAVVVEGESLSRFDEPSWLISYRWDDGGYPEHLPVDCDGGPIP